LRLVVAYGAGGASDILVAYILAEQFGRSLNQQFIVENKPGAGTPRRQRIGLARPRRTDTPSSMRRAVCDGRSLVREN